MRAGLVAALYVAMPLAAPPRAVVADTQNVVLEVAPLSPQGSAVEQARRALKSLRSNLVAVTAFVVGTEDAEAVGKALDESLAKHGKARIGEPRAARMESGLHPARRGFSPLRIGEPK